MAWLGVCYKGEQSNVLSNIIDKHKAWLKGDRMPKLYGDNFFVIYDSNTAREFIKKIKSENFSGKIIVYTIPSVLLEIEK